MNLFDAAEADRRKEEGRQRAAAANPWLLATAQRCARRVAERLGSVSMDDVALELASAGEDVSRLGNAAGSVFRGEEWEWTGQVVRSARPSTHGRMIRVWRLRGAGGAR